MNHSTPPGDRIWGMWDVMMILDNSVFYLLKGDYRCRRGAWKKKSEGGLQHGRFNGTFVWEQHKLPDLMYRSL